MNYQIRTPLRVAKVLQERVRVDPGGGAASLLCVPGILPPRRRLQAGQPAVLPHFLHGPFIEVSSYPLVSTEAWYLGDVSVPTSDHLPLGDDCNCGQISTTCFHGSQPGLQLFLDL